MKVFYYNKSRVLNNLNARMINIMRVMDKSSIFLKLEANCENKNNESYNKYSPCKSDADCI